jgi:glycosyltransferase involved in cell wall biosynthesis
MEIAALIPAYREERYIADVVRRAAAQVDFVLVVDDGSGDATGGMACEAGAEVLLHENNLGKGAAIKSGLRHLMRRGCDYVVILDGDGQHLPEEIPAFVEAARREEDIRLWLGNRMSDTRSMPLARRLTNRFMSWLLSQVCRQSIPDSQCGFRLVHPSLIPLLECESSAFDYESEMLIRVSRAGERIGAVPITTVYRDEVSSIRPARDAMRFFRLIWRHTRKPATPPANPPSPSLQGAAVARGK